MTENSKPNLILNASFLLVFIPAYTYFVSFEYEQGFCNQFNIPNYLIEPNLNTLLIFATTIIGILLSCLKILGFALPFFKAINNEEKKHLRIINFINGFCFITGVHSPEIG